VEISDCRLERDIPLNPPSKGDLEEQASKGELERRLEIK